MVLDEGLREMFEDILPIDDFQGNLSLEFVDYELKTKVHSKKPAHMMPTILRHYM